MQPFFTEVGKGAALLLIALLCMFTALVAATGAIPPVSDLNKGTLTVVLLYILPNIIFLAYRQMYSAPQSDDHDGAKWFRSWIAVITLAMLLIVFLSPDVFLMDFIAATTLSAPLFYYCYESHRLYDLARNSQAEADRQQGFENLIFIPAFLLCMVNFSLGLLLARRLNIADGNVWLLNAEDLPYLAASLCVVACYYQFHVRAAIIYVAFPLAVVVLGFFAFFAFGLTSGRYLALAIMITFFLGFGEVTKNLYFIQKKAGASQTAPTSQFFMEGANWSGVVYPTVFLLAPVIFIEMSYPPVIGIVYFFVLFWLAQTPRQKTSFRALIVGFAVGYGTPLAFVLSIAHYFEFHTAPITDQSPFQTLLALIALVGFMAGLLRLSKDLFGLNLAAFFRNVWNRNLYANEAACLFLLLSIALLVCVVLTCAWFILAVFPQAPVHDTKFVPYYSRLASAGVAVVILSVLAVALTVFRPKRLEAIISAAASINVMTPPSADATSAQQPQSGTGISAMRVAILIVQSGRLGVSFIAGLAAAIIVYQSTAVLMQTVATFVAFTSVTMSGFLMNDIYDREKDHLAGKRRPIAEGTLSVRAAWVAVAVLVVAALLLAYVTFNFTAAIWIALIAFALCAYSPTARKLPAIKGLYTAALALTPFMFVHNVVGFALPFSTLVLLLSYIVFREAVLDARDIEGDLASGIRTVAYFFGSTRTAFIGWTGMLGSLAISFLFLNTLPSQMIMTVGLIIQLAAAVLFVFRQPASLGLTRLPMVSGVLAIAFNG